MTMKEHEKHFGLIAVGKEFITLEDLMKALRLQAKEAGEDKGQMLIGQILIKMGVMNAPQVMEVLNTMDSAHAITDDVTVRE